MQCPRCKSKNVAVSVLIARPDTPDQQQLCCDCGWSATFPMPPEEEPFAIADQPEVDEPTDIDPE